MFQKAKRITLGILFLALAASGAVIPIMPGWPFLVLALVILSRDLPFLRPLRHRLEARFPRLREPIARWEARLGLIDPLAERDENPQADGGHP